MIIVYGRHVRVERASMYHQGTSELWIVELELLMYIFLALHLFKVRGAVLLLLRSGSRRRRQDVLSAIGSCVNDLKPLRVLL